LKKDIKFMSQISDFILRFRDFVMKISPWLADKGGRFYVNFILPFVPKDCLVTKKMIGDYGPFKFHARFFFRNFSHWGIGHNRDFKDSIEACRNKKAVIDIGTHIGLVSMPASSVLAPGAKVYSFEPAEAERTYLKEHIRLNNIQNIEVFDNPVGKDHGKEIVFYQQDDESGTSSVTIANKPPELFRKTTKKLVSLDCFCKEKNILPDVVKLDAEGNEYDVLEGALETLNKARPLIFISLHKNHLENLGRNIDELHDIMKKINYECVNVDGSAPDRLVSREYIMRPL